MKILNLIRRFTPLFIMLIALFACHAAPALSQNVDELSPRYDMAVSLFPETHRLEASGTIRLPADKTARSQLELSLSDLMRDLRVEVIEPKTSAGTARVEKKEKERWIITPLQPILAGEPVLLRFSYAGGEGTSVVFYLGAEGSFAGGLNTTWYPQPNKAKGIGMVKFSVPVGYSVMATGTQRQTSEEAAQGNFRFEVEKPTYFGFAAARYTVVRQTNGAVPVSAYLLRPRENIKEYLDGCSKFLNLLAQEFGVYPHSEFALVEVPPEQASKAGFTGASIDGFILANTPSVDKKFNLAYYAHEIGHQWWGNAIRTKDIHGSYMLGEGMAQYGSLRVVEIVEGANAAEEFRRTGYPEYSADQSGRGYLQLSAAGLDHRLSDLPGSSLSHLLANNKGFLVFDLLSRTIGRERFRLILRDFTRQNAFKLITWDEFLRAIEKGAGQDLKWFFAQWFEQTGAPDWQLAWRQNGKVLRAEVKQNPPFYHTTVEIQIEGRNKQQLTRSIEIRQAAQTEITLPVNFRVKSVTLDPHFLILHWMPEYRADAASLVPFNKIYWKSESAGAQFNWDEVNAEYKTAVEQAAKPNDDGKRFLLEYGWGRILITQQKWSEAKTHLETALANRIQNKYALPRVYYLLATIAKQTGDESALRQAVEAAIKADTVIGGTNITSRARALLPNNQKSEVNTVESKKEADAPQATSITGKLLGSDGNPMPKADVHLVRFNQSKPLVSIEAAKDGGFRLTTNESGLFTIQFTGANHKSHETVLLIEKPVEAEINVKLKTYEYATNFSEVKIIGDFNNFSFSSAKAMEKQPDGTYTAEFEATGGKFTYQLIGLTTSGGSVNGTQSDDYIYDGGGDYRSVVTPVNGRAKIVFNSSLLVRSNAQAQITFRDAKSPAARFASIYEAMLERRKPLQKAIAAYKKTGKPLENFKYDWSAVTAALSKQINREKNLLLRQALLIGYLDLGYTTFGPKIDPVLAKQALAAISSTSPLWSIEPRLLGVALNNSGQPENYTSYVQQLVENHPDAVVKRIAKAEYAPTRNIMVGKVVPPFSLISIIDPKTIFTSESLKGKIVLIDFWATWCVPCIEELPNLHKIYEKYKGKNFEILSISLDEREETVQKFRAEKWKMPWLHTLMSSGKDVQRQFEIVGIPKAILIDATGKIIATEKDLRGKNLAETLMRVFGETK